MVFQIAIARIVTVVANEVLFAKSCPLSVYRKYGSVAILTIQSVSTSIAVFGNILFEARLRQQLGEHGTLFKLISFKGVVGFQAIQDVLFSVLAEKRLFYPTSPYHISYNDFSKGIRTCYLS